ncbi:uncharacterized protein LOC134239348 [Saccostrea cucullata]|uniref:uncharacterized protein LOC134239348 n=1 Tax=Saccostrea cuccullata TaxID=36930 RepID=UPI002ED56DCD
MMEKTSGGLDISGAFDSSIIQHACDDEEAKMFANLMTFNEKVFFFKTKFHYAFMSIIDGQRDSQNEWNYVYGIQGLGKSSSALYYVLECRRNNDANIHYIDLQHIEKCDENLEKFTSFSEKIPENSCLVIDHVTIFNDHYREKVYKIVKQKVSRFIVIETGFTSSAHTGSIDCGRELQLDEDSFLTIWNGTLKMKGCQEQRLAQKGKEVYEEFSKLFIMSPRLLHEVLDYMYSYRSLDKKVKQVLWQYIKIKQAEIAGFKGCGENKTYAKLILHTTLLLEHIPDDGPYIFTTEQARKVMIAVNIFETEYCNVTKDDMDKYAELSKLAWS